MPDNIISTEEFFNLEQGTENVDQENIFSIEELSKTGEWGQRIETEPQEVTSTSNFNSKDLILNEKKREWWLWNAEGKVVDRLNKQLKKQGWEAEDETGEWGDVLGGNMFSIYKSGGKDEDTKLVIDLNNFVSLSGSMIPQFGEEGRSGINKALRDHIQDHINLHSGSDDTETKEAREKVKTMVSNDLISVEGDLKIDEEGQESVLDYSKRQLKNRELKSILKPLDDKIINTIAKKNSIPLTDADKKLSIPEFLKKYSEQINVGYDYERLLRSEDGSPFWDSTFQDVLEYYKNKTGQGKGVFGRETDTDAWVFGATSWDPEGEFASLSERQIEKYIKEGVQMYADHQASTINELREDQQSVILDYEGLTTDEVVINEYKKNEDNKEESVNIALEKHGENSLEYKKAVERHDFSKMTTNYHRLYQQWIKLASQKDIDNTDRLQEIQAEMSKIDIAIKDAHKDLYGDTQIIYSDKDGVRITKEEYDKDGGNQMSESELQFKKNLIIAQLAPPDSLPIDNNSDLTTEEYEKLLHNTTTYGSLADYQADQITYLNTRDFMRQQKGQYVINDYIAWEKLDELMKDPIYKDRVRQIDSENQNGRVYEIDMGVLEEFYEEIIAEDGVRFGGRLSGDNPQINESRGYETNSGFFARTGDVDEFESSTIAPYIIGGGEGQNNGFINMIKDNKALYIGARDKLNVANQMLMERVDPTKKAKNWTNAGVFDFIKNTGETWNQVKWGTTSVDGVVYNDDNRNGNGNYMGADYSNMKRKEIQSQVFEAAEIKPTEEQKEAWTKGIGYSAWDGTVSFVPLVAEFAATEVGLVAAEVLTFGGGTIPVAAAQTAMLARWSNKLLNIGRGGKVIPQLARSKTAATIFTPLEKVAKVVPGAGKRADWYQKYLTSSKVYRGANGVRLTEKELVRLERLTKESRGTAAFTKAVGIGGGRGGSRWGGITHGRSALNTVTHNLYHGLREELKMGLTFKEHYHAGGGVAFYGVGKLLAKTPFKFTEKSIIGSKAPLGVSTKTGLDRLKTKLGLSGKVTLENYSNILNSGLGLGRSGVAGMISVPLASTFEKFVEDAGGGKTFDFIDDMYPELNMKNALTNFFTYQMLGIKGIFGPKNTGLKTVRSLERLEKMSEIQMERAFKEGYNVKKKKWENKELEEKYSKYNELARAVKSKTDVLRNTQKWMDPKWAEKEYRKIMDNHRKNFKENTGEEIGEVHYVNTAENLVKNKGRVATVLGGAAAGIELNKKTGKYDLFLDVSRATPGKIPHEIQHFLDKTVLENDPLAASRLVEVMMEKMGGEILTSQNKYKIVNGKKVLDLDANGRLQTKDYTVKEWVEENYILDTHEGNIEALGYFSELLSTTKHFHKFTRGGKENSWKKLETSIKEWQAEHHGKDFDFATLPKSTKQQIINFLAEMAQAGKKGKTDARYIKLYKTLGESLIYDQPNGFQGTQTKMSNKSLDLNEQKVNLQETLDGELSGKKFAERTEGLDKQGNEYLKKREAYFADVKEKKEQIAELDKKILESEKDFKFEKDIENIYNNTRDVNEAAWEVAKQYDPRVSESAGASRIERELTKPRGRDKNSYSSLPDYEFFRGDILNDLLTDGKNRSIRQMVLDYDPNNKLGPKGETVPLSGYIGSVLSKRGISESVSKYIKEGVGMKPGVIEGRYVAGGVEPTPVEGVNLDFDLLREGIRKRLENEEISPEKAEKLLEEVAEFEQSKFEQEQIIPKREDLSAWKETSLHTWASDIQTRKTGKLLKTKPGEVDAVKKKIKDIDINNASVQTIENLLPEFTKELFGKGPLENTKFIAENAETMKDIFFKGTMEMSGQLGKKIGAIARKANKKKGIEKGDIVAAEGATTKVPGSILNRMFTAGERASFAKTGQAGGNPQQVLDKMSEAEFLKRIGIEIVDNKAGIISERLRQEALNKYGEKSKQYKEANKEYRNVTETLFPQIRGIFGRVKSIQIIEDLANQPGAKEQLGIKHNLMQFNQLLKAGFSDMMLSLDYQAVINDIFKLKKVNEKTLMDVFNSYDLNKKEKEKVISLFDGIYKTLRDKKGEPDYEKYMEVYAKEAGTTVEALEKIEITTEKAWKKIIEGQGFEYKTAKDKQESIGFQALRRKFALDYIKEHGRWDDLPLWYQDRVMDAVGFGENKDINSNRWVKKGDVIGLTEAHHALSAKEKRELSKQAKKGFTPKDVIAELNEQVRRVTNRNTIIEYFGKEVLNGKKLTKKEIKALDDVYFPTNMGVLKRKTAKLHEKHNIDTEKMTEADAWNYIVEAANIISGGKDYSKVLKANKNQAKKEFNIIKKLINKGEITTTEGVMDYLQGNTNRSKGWLKGLYTVTGLTKVRSKPTENDGWSGTHAEHELQLFKMATSLFNIAKNTSGKKWTTSRDALMDKMEQSIIAKELQLYNDSGAMNGASGLPPGMKHNLGVYSKLIFMTRPEVAENMYYIPASLEAGRPITIAEHVRNTIAKSELLDLLKSVPNKNISHERMRYEVENKSSIEQARKAQVNQLEKGSGMSHSKDMSSKEIKEKMKTLDEAAKKGRKRKKVARGMSTFDFDETVGMSENFVIARKGKETKRIASDKWPFVGEKMVKEGWKMDFSDFNKVTKGKPGPLMEKMKNQIKKFGPDNVFILTARAKESAPAIHEWLKTQGVKIPLENITGLGNSTGEAKAMWMLEKFSEGYNDMYFVDDALPNVKAVKNVLNQLDIKSKVQQAIMKSLDLSKDVNDIMEHSLDVGSEKVFSKAEAKVRGKDIKRRRYLMRDSAADLELLIEPLYGKGKKGIENKKWFKEEFIKPWERGIRDYNTARQTAKNDYMGLRKQNKDVVKEINKEVEGTTFTNDMAMRVYLWNKAGYKIPDLAKTTEAKLVEHIRNNPRLQAYAEKFAEITKQEKGLKEPGQNWWAETMAGEITNINRGVSRKQYLQEFLDIKNEIFSEANLNKMESKLGTRWRENIEDMFDRMETGRTRSLKLDRGSAAMMNYLNGGIGTIMNYNTRSAVLQTISTTNFLNMRENNPIAAAKAMGNTKQFVKDFKYIMNSDMLKQRRDGLAMNVTEAELASAAASSKNPINSIIAKVLKHGYLPTKMADSFAIAFGGATFYRNRIKMYEKQGMKTKEAEKKAWLDFQMLAERTQQSSRADLLSKQQTSLVGRFVLPFANTLMQMNRAGMKDILDLSKGRYKDKVEAAEKAGRATYYMGVQLAVFAGLQSALFAMLFNDDDVADEKIANTKSYTMHNITDGMLRGFGVPGAVASGLKNATVEYFKQSEKGYSADYSEVAEDLLNISPPLGSKFGMLDYAGDKEKWAKIKGDDKFKFEFGNPSLEASLMTIQAITNAPVYAPYQNMHNLKHAMSDQYEIWQRVHMVGGYTPWSVGIETEKKKKKKKKKGFGEGTFRKQPRGRKVYKRKVHIR